jgi:transposase-like protein
VQRRACYLAMAIGVESAKCSVCGSNEGAKFWMHVLADPKQRGVNNILIA